MYFFTFDPTQNIYLTWSHFLILLVYEKNSAVSDWCVYYTDKAQRLLW